jgi:polyhydroxyalkanoate synthesis repressor PhaR
MSQPADPNAKRLEIKKYPNRRYYDATHSRHLTLDEIQSLVQQGYDITVVDAKTKADITAQVLTHIILELDTPKLDSFPVPLLVRIIRMNDRLVKDFVEKYFNQALKSFLDYQQQVEEQIRRAHGLPSVFPSVSAWTKAMFEPLATAFSAGSTTPAQTVPGRSAGTTHPPVGETASAAPPPSKKPKTGRAPKRAQKRRSRRK